jgi:hypothetical protein
MAGLVRSSVVTGNAPANADPDLHELSRTPTCWQFTEAWISKAATDKR